MPIPPLGADGVLPSGTHDCSLEEIEEIFGRFRRSDRRIRLTKGLFEYVTLLQEAEIGRYLYVDGSYVTGEDEPNDFDLLLVLPEQLDLSRQIPPFEYTPDLAST